MFVLYEKIMKTNTYFLISTFISLVISLAYNLLNNIDLDYFSLFLIIIGIMIITSLLINRKEYSIKNTA